MKLLFFNDREKILQKARKIKDVLFKGGKVLSFPDFSAEECKIYRYQEAVAASKCAICNVISGKTAASWLERNEQSI